MFGSLRLTSQMNLNAEYRKTETTSQIELYNSNLSFESNLKKKNRNTNKPTNGTIKINRILNKPLALFVTKAIWFRATE